MKTSAVSSITGNGTSEKRFSTLQKAAELEILNADNESTLESLNKFVESKISEMFGKISDQKEVMNKKLCDYYKSKDKHVNLIEKHKMDFIHSINSVENEIKRSVETALKNTYELKKGSKQAQDIQRKYRGEIEKQVMKLLKDCKGSKLTDEQLTQEFEQMWTKATETVPGLTERDIPAHVLNQLRNSFSNLNINETLPNTEELKELGKDQFKEAEKTTLFQIQSTCSPFKDSLIKSLTELEEQLKEDFSNSEDIAETLKKLPIKPQDELFKRVFGCGQQCPFCKVPCEAGGNDHKIHHASVHRPQGLGTANYADSQKLAATLCTTDVTSECRFRNSETKNKCHPYKDYSKYYPDWHIPPDPSQEASDYWKYVLVQYNERFAQIFEAKPADVPGAWRRIGKEEALKGLKDAFNIK
ncbi:hypothetical protein L3Q82_000048 [Scortum barcoo]|uniref:Uncharacterized protein n=1 Tax=Scortum barcoo TaxID=214431 RepID=A0ACB8XA90_9TELE|nr:hypothetical protein L3Q82_000048 [Scortum barcoo]